MKRLSAQDQLAQDKAALLQFLQDFLATQEKSVQRYTWGAEIFQGLTAYATQGKMIRGCLLLLSYRLFGGDQKYVPLHAAAALELTHSGLLIHDDMIDRDEKRRGQPAFHIQLTQRSQEMGYIEADHHGQSIALCAGDITFFLSFELLSQLKSEDLLVRQLMQLFAREFTQVGFAETQDIHQGLTTKQITEDDIFSMYKYKTGRYTFSLPLSAGALLASQPVSVQGQLGTLGETLGLIFQLKDDELGLFGTEAEIGKVAGSDVREGKKTLYYLYSLELATSEDRERLKRLFGKRDITDDELEQVRTLVISSGTKAKVDQKIKQLQDKAQAQIGALPLSDTARTELLALMQKLGQRRA